MHVIKYICLILSYMLALILLAYLGELRSSVLLWT